MDRKNPAEAGFFLRQHKSKAICLLLRLEIRQKWLASPEITLTRPRLWCLLHALVILAPSFWGYNRGYDGTIN